jgi:glutamate N-acetyltransferase / amino-acid N-acetyltransferase
VIKNRGQNALATCAPDRTHFPVFSPPLTFSSRVSHRAWLTAQASLPLGFRVGSARLEFLPKEAPKPAKMTLTLIALQEPTADFAAVFTRNALPGAPVILGRRRLDAPQLGAIVINNKISNVCAPDGVEASEAVSAATAALLGLEASAVLLDGGDWLVPPG